MRSATRAIPRVWEGIRVLPAREDGPPWAPNDWLLDTAERPGASEVGTVASSYLGDLRWTIGRWDAAQLLVPRYSGDDFSLRSELRRGRD